MSFLPNDRRMRPTLTLALIARNEEKNLPRLLDSVRGCFDEIVLVDTGSTDKTKVIAAEYECKIHDFTWIDDFSAARNFAFSKASGDYIMWLDCDDVLKNRENFIKWRDHAMTFVDYWLATYNYALDKDGKPLVSFMRERVVKRSLGATWNYPLHEGILFQNHWSMNYATPWAVDHMRDEEDMKADRSRNINILENLNKTTKLDGRMTFYYGKELYEIGRHKESIPIFERALEMTLEPHDRLLTLQYIGYAAMAVFDAIQSKEIPGEQKDLEHYFNVALDYSHKGIRIEPNRAEFWVTIGDAYVRVKNLAVSVPYFAGAKACLKNFDTAYEGAIYSFRKLYGEAPSLQLAKVYAHLGLLDQAKKEAQNCIDSFGNEEARDVLTEISRVSTLTSVKNNQKECDDIVFTTPPQNAYPFDEEIYKTKPLGGSETALVQMARLLREKTGRRVIVFNQRQDSLVADSGVEYVSNAKVAEYFSKWKPSVHIAWRHNIKLTDAPTYLWCHDLFTPGCEKVHNFDKMLCLSPFSKNYVQGLQGIPEEKIIVTRNGIDPKKFAFDRKPKNENKVVWLSSPDRGLERALLVMDEARKEFPNLELHVYYGIEGLYNYGPVMSALADKLKSMMFDRPWVKYHGFTEQNKMYQEVSDAVVWLHPNNFIETFCISAIECLANGILPVVRRLGALADTLKEAEACRGAIMLDYEWSDEDAVKKHANALCRALLNRQWENIKFDISKHDWASIADEWIETMNIKSLVNEATG